MVVRTRETKSEAKRYAARVARALAAEYPVVHCSLHFDSPLQLLVATILSAQCTDERVNQVTEQLFARYPTAEDLATVRLPTLEKLIHSTGFFRNKAKNIKACCQTLVEQYDGQVPRTLDELVPLPGVGRKTANVVLGNAFGIASGVVVDTHVTRICVRLGIVTTKDAVKIEKNSTSFSRVRSGSTFRIGASNTDDGYARRERNRGAMNAGCNGSARKWASVKMESKGRRKLRAG